MLSDIEIAQSAELKPIAEIANQLGISADELEFYGKYKAKLSDELADRVKDNPDGKLILVTAINPTPAGEGKTTTSAGLGQAMAKIGKKAIIALREPSLGCVSLPLDHVSELKAVPQAAVMHRFFRWRTLTFISPVICTQLQQPTTFVAQCLTTTFSRATHSALIREEFSSSVVLI